MNDLVRFGVVALFLCGLSHFGCHQVGCSRELPGEVGAWRDAAREQEPAVAEQVLADGLVREASLPDITSADATTRDVVPAKGRKLVLALSFPPVSDEASRQFTQAHTAADALRVRLIRFTEDWAIREPTKGKMNVTPLLQRLEWAKKQGLSVFLTLQSNGPEWACVPGSKNKYSCRFRNDDDWKRFLDVLFAAFKQNDVPIHAIQFGNEWQSTYWYPGSAEEFVRAHNAVVDALKRHQLKIPVVLGGFSTGALRALAACEKKITSFYDDEGNFLSWGASNPAHDLEKLCAGSLVISTKKKIEHILRNARYAQLDLHLYDDVENWGVYVQYFRDRWPGVPIVVTEFGGPNLVWEKPYSDDQQSRRLATYIEKLQSLDLVAAYYFKLVQSDSAHFTHLESGLFRLVGNVPQKKPAYDVFKRYSNPPAP